MTVAKFLELSVANGAKFIDLNSEVTFTPPNVSGPVTMIPRSGYPAISPTSNLYSRSRNSAVLSFSSAQMYLYGAAVAIGFICYFCYECFIRRLYKIRSEKASY